MKKILKVGTVPVIDVYPATCTYCTTEFQFTEDEGSVLTGNEETIGTHCPICSKQVIVAKNSVVKVEEKELMGHNKLVSYILANWDKLPKSSFNDDVCVIFDIEHEDDGGWGNHSFSGYGVDAQGNIVHAQSSGCSCDGSCCMNVMDITVEVEERLKFDNYTPELINFSSLDRSFSDYG